MTFRAGKLYDFSKTGIIVASQWPDMRAWRKTPKGSRWMQIRPLLRLEKSSKGWSFDLDRREPRMQNRVSGEPIRFRIEQDPSGEESMDADEFYAEYRMELDDDIPEDGEKSPYVVWWDKVEKQRREAKAEYLQPIPEAVLDAVADYPCRHWHLLNLVSRCPGALDLVRSNPALAFCLASLWVFRNPAPCRPLRSARSLIRKPQAEIAAWLGFPGTRSAVRVIRKLEARDCTIPNLLALRQLFASHGKKLRHLPRIDSELLRLLTWEGDHCRFSVRFLHEMVSSTSPLEMSDSAYVRDVLWMRQYLGEGGALVVRSRLQLSKMHDRCVDRMGRTDLRVLNHPPFPDPPLAPSNPFLEMAPLQNEAELLAEGKIQRNCVGAYGRRVRTGKLFVYRLLSPERATLSVALARSGRWQLSEIKTSHNGKVGTETLEAVQYWVDEAWRGSLAGCASRDEPF